MTDWHVPFEIFEAGVKASGRAHVGLRHGSMRVVLFQPTPPDNHSPHTQDEVYVVRSGDGDLIVESERQTFKTGDVLFVGAGQNHRFENFSDDFSAWAFFWGPEGGEA